MRNFVDGEEQVVVRRAANNIGRQDEERGERVGITEKDCYSKLQRDDAENDPFCDGLVAHKFRHLETREYMFAQSTRGEEEVGTRGGRHDRAEG